MAGKTDNTTLRYCSTCILLLICSLYFGRVNSRFQDVDDTPDCGMNAACKTVIEYGEILYRSKLDICKCADETSCPTSHSITRYIGTRTTEPNPLFIIYFCKPLFTEKLKTCKPGEISMSFKGSTMLPSTVKEVFCSCPENDTLHLSMIKSLAFKKTEFYTCSMPVCNTTDVGHACSHKIDSKSTRYLCRCPANHVCEKQQATKSNIYQCQQESHSV